MPKLPIGTIVFWTGPIARIPRAWTLCDGTNDTPDLRNHFIIGAGGGYWPGRTASNPLHRHSLTGDGHIHSIPSGTDLAFHPFEKLEETDSSQVDGITDFGEIVPPFRSMYLIMYTAYH
ncbi:MAG: hypothetical protein V3W44_10335 [Dehalococcoidales bacterium]